MYEPTAKRSDTRMILDIKTYEQLGYYPIELKPSSHKQILVECDYCKNIITKARYHVKLNYKEKHACKSCKTKKQQETIKTTNGMMDKINKTRAQTNIAKYGTISPANNKEIQDKIKKNNLEKYGVPYHIQSQEVKDKIKSTIQKRYGVDNVFSLPEIQKRAKELKIEKYGADGISYGKTEQEIRDFLNQHETNFISDHTLVPPKEIDGYDASKNLAFEYCGLYWHTEHLGRTKHYHRDKYKSCLDKNVQLITIFEDEWVKNKDAIKNHLLSCIGKTEKIGARTCDVEVISHDLAKDFLTKYHIQGSSNHSKLAIGLFKNKELLGVMTFSAHHRLNTNDVVVLSRMAFKFGISISGGASKMLSFATPQLRLMKYSKIISWSDNRYSLGKVYDKMGFILTKEYGPDYSYVNIKKPTFKRIPKQSCKKSLLGAAKGQTEKQRAEELGYSRIWDCGKKKWEKKI